MNSAKFWRITTSAYSGARNTTCWRRQLSVREKILAMHGGGDDELHREMDTNRDVREETAMAWH